MFHVRRWPMNPHNPCSFMSLLNGDDEPENRSNTNVPTNPHMLYVPYPLPPNYPFPTYYLSMSSGGGNPSPTLLPPPY